MTATLHFYTDGRLLEPFQPQETDKALRAFPAGVMHLIPPAEAIPEKFEEGETVWVKFVRQMSTRGIDKHAEFHAKPGISAETAFWHLHCIMGSYDPTHEQKEAAVAFLASQWFEKVLLHGEVYQ